MSAARLTVHEGVDNNGRLESRRARASTVGIGGGGASNWQLVSYIKRMVASFQDARFFSRCAPGPRFAFPGLANCVLAGRPELFGAANPAQLSNPVGIEHRNALLNGEVVDNVNLDRI